MSRYSPIKAAVWLAASCELRQFLNQQGLTREADAIEKLTDQVFAFCLDHFDEEFAEALELVNDTLEGNSNSAGEEIVH
ncbi:hypothetical protein [Sneathiella sp. HT1-7]|uniref:hypothetical protein n=1 Tax=Sneathiella sp. HT1-7 TaxID=2887192 RepID=UPI001D14026B|nr:hypothetical protein [Sneathiella sp. HT1-7]MCC3303822.1 hypothetical protein [Sneathiella sp. HT1-7]